MTRRCFVGLFAVMSLFALAQMTSGPAEAASTSRSVWDQDYFDPCTNEYVHLHGTAVISFRERAKHSIEHASIHVHGVGESGARYVGMEVINYVTQFRTTGMDSSWSETDVKQFRLN